MEKRISITVLSRQLPARLEQLPPPQRASACAALGDAVWGAIRLQVKCRTLIWMGDFVWGMIKAHLLRLSNQNQPAEPDRLLPEARPANPPNPIWNMLVACGSYLMLF